MSTTILTDENRRTVARAIWSIRREEEDRCDMELEDMPPSHSVWAEADAAIGAIEQAVLQSEQVQAWKKEAERYRWLRTRWGRLDESYDDGGRKITSLRVLTDQEVKDGYGWDVDPDSLDRAIDAAMQRTNGGDHADS